MSLDFRAQCLFDLLHAGRILDKSGMCVATDGNFSGRIEGDRVLVTRSGIEKRGLTPDSFVEINLKDNHPSSASTEWPLHRILYTSRSDVQCVLHVHAPCLTTFAVAGRVPPAALLAEALQSIGEIVWVRFCNPGSEELAKVILAASASASVYLLANHGAVAVGSSVMETLYRLERAEFLARIALQSAALGGPIPMSSQQIAALSEGASC